MKFCDNFTPVKINIEPNKSVNIIFSFNNNHPNKYAVIILGYAILKNDSDFIKFIDLYIIKEPIKPIVILNNNDFPNSILLKFSNNLLDLNNNKLNNMINPPKYNIDNESNGLS